MKTISSTMDAHLEHLRNISGSGKPCVSLFIPVKNTYSPVERTLNKLIKKANRLLKRDRKEPVHIDKAPLIGILRKGNVSRKIAKQDGKDMFAKLPRTKRLSRYE